MYLDFNENNKFITIIFDNFAMDEQEIFIKKFLLTKFYKIDIKSKRKILMSRVDKNNLNEKDINLIEYNLSFIYKAIDLHFENIIKAALKSDVLL